MAIVKITRVLEYEGEERAIIRTLANGYIPPNGSFDVPLITITSKIVDHPEIIWSRIEQGDTQ